MRTAHCDRPSKLTSMVADFFANHVVEAKGGQSTVGIIATVVFSHPLLQRQTSCKKLDHDVVPLQVTQDRRHELGHGVKGFSLLGGSYSIEVVKRSSF